MKDTFEIQIGEKAKVFTPYNRDFVSKVKLLGGKWNAADRCWEVIPEAVEDVRKLMREVYGRDDSQMTETMVVRITFTDKVVGDEEPVIILGKTIASAFGRDSGAKIPDDVLFEKGAPTSGGSRRYWETVIPAGCVCRVYNVPKADIEKAELPKGVQVEIVENKVDREALLEEKQKLLARLAEIEELLK